jgi:hypothetical protein
MDVSVMSYENDIFYKKCAEFIKDKLGIEPEYEYVVNFIKYVMKFEADVNASKQKNLLPRQTSDLGGCF